MKTGRLARLWRRLGIRLKEALGQNIFLCDNCKWNWPNACHRRERPNATECPDYAAKGR